MLVDSHFNLDKALGRSDYTIWDNLQEGLQGRWHLELAVANSVFPRDWGIWERQVGFSRNLSLIWTSSSWGV